MQAMILAAGFGTRLRPYTEIKPKPIFPVCNTPLLLLTINNLKSSGFSKIIVNCHHLADQVIRHISDISGVIIQHEDIILGTGGGLRRALPNLDDSPLLIVNGDIYHTVSYEKLYSAHEDGGGSVTMALHDLPRFNKVKVEQNRVVGFAGELENSLAFTGIHVINPDILYDIQDNSFSCIIDRYKDILQKNGEIGVYRVDDCFWSDMGTVPDYLKLHADLLQNDNSIPTNHNGAKVLAGDNTVLGENLEVKDWACIGHNVKIGKSVYLERTVVWDGAVLESNKEYTDTIVV